MKKKFEKFLKENNLLPVNKKNWHFLEVDHSGSGRKVRESNELAIENGVGDSSGIYIYEQSGKVIYVGKGNPLRNRLKSHYRESFEPVPGDTEDKRWYRFFSRHKGKLMVYWTELSEVEGQEIIEKMLEDVLEPEFKNFK